MPAAPPAGMSDIAIKNSLEEHLNNQSIFVKKQTDTHGRVNIIVIIRVNIILLLKTPYKNVKI